MPKKIGKYDVEHRSEVLLRQIQVDGGIKLRHDSLTIAPVDGIYNQLLFDLCGKDDLISLALLGSYNKALDAIGWQTSDANLIHEDVLTYIGAAGTAAGTATEDDGIHEDACAPGTGHESGTCTFQLQGWGRLRKTSDTRDITDHGMRYCENQPIYDIAGERIDSDYEWDVVRQAQVLVHNVQRRILLGDNATAGDADGLLKLIDFNYTDPVTAEACTSMDSIVIDWNDNEMCPTDGALGVTFNGNLITDGYGIIDLIKSSLTRVHQRISMSSMNGAAPHIALITTQALECLIECYVCHTVCNNCIEEMNSKEAREEMARLKNTLGEFGVVMMSFNGYPVMFFPYDWGLYNSVDGNSEFIILTPTIGNQPLVRLQAKDMNLAKNMTAKTQTDFMVSDQSRWLHWQNIDNTCYTVSVEMQWRVYMPHPWAQIKFENVVCSTALGGISADPLSTVFPEQNPVANPAFPVV